MNWKQQHQQHLNSMDAVHDDVDDDDENEKKNGWREDENCTTLMGFVRK